MFVLAVCQRVAGWSVVLYWRLLEFGSCEGEKAENIKAVELWNVYGRNG